MSITAEQRELAMWMLADMMIEDRAQRENVSAKELFREFRRSNTMEMLFNAETGVWTNGPAYLSDEWDRELQGGRRSRLK